MRIDQWREERRGAGISIVVDEKEAVAIIARLSSQLVKLRLIQDAGHFAEVGHLISTDGVMLAFSVVPRAAHTQPGEDVNDPG